MIIVYDKTFESFLTLVYEVYYKKIQVTQIISSLPTSLFNDEIIQIQFDEIKSLKVLEVLKQKFEKSCFEIILNTFMCDSESFEMELLAYIILGFKDQKELENINHSCVFYINNLQKEFFRLYHRMSGFVRFEELSDGTLYAKIETKFNIVYFLGKHFCKRFNNQNFIIHDIQRKLVFIKNEIFTGIQEVAHFEIPQHSQNEAKFQKLWKTFFEATSIELRENKKLQQQWVPLIYREYMNEFS
jgi:probable DNA metabolism protein